MSRPGKNKARREAGLFVADHEANATAQSGVSICDANHIRKVVKELHDNCVGLGCTSGESRRSTLLRALKFRGARGLNTYEGTAGGYCRLATRIKELQETWEIDSLRENIIGPDGLYHPRVARYILIGRKTESPQLPLPLEGE